jgi:hypothetical protein
LLAFSAAWGGPGGGGRASIGRLPGLLLALALLGAKPCGLIPGGALEGQLAQPPPDWSALGEDIPCQLELRPEKPYSVNVGCHVRDGRLYVYSLLGAHKRWTALVEEDPELRVRIDGHLYELEAVRVREPDERRRVLSPDGGEPSDGTWLYRLDPRR